MDWTGETERGAWIGPRLKGPMGAVSSTVPSGFAAYARVLHPSGVTRYHPRGRGDVQEDYSEEAWTWAQVAAHTQAVIHPQVQWIRVTGHQYDATPLPGGRSADPPPLGHLESHLLSHIMTIAGRHTSTPDEVTAALWEGWGIDSGTQWFATSVPDGQAEEVDAPVFQSPARAVDPGLSKMLRHGPFLELPGRRYVLLDTSTLELSDAAWPLDAGMGWAPGISGPMPQLIWPADHAWSTASEIDFDSTLIGGTFDFINEVVDHPAVEAFHVSASTDLTWDADDINRPTEESAH